jgi:dienelactone hydrolase
MSTSWEKQIEAAVASRQASAPRRQRGHGLSVGTIATGAILLLLGVGAGWMVLQSLSPTSFPEETESYSQARKSFQTKLVRKGAAPQAAPRAVPPANVKEIEYVSGSLRLKAWVNRFPAKGAPRPAVLFLHGGFAFDQGDWQQSQQFRDDGFVVMTPILRGENGQPGNYSMFYDEVEDVCAAAEVLAQMPGVDSKRIFVAGHSAGGTLALLGAMTSDRFRAAASFSGSPDQVAWSRGQSKFVPFDPSDNREYQLRSPLAFPKSFKCPVRITTAVKKTFSPPVVKRPRSWPRLPIWMSRQRACPATISLRWTWLSIGPSCFSRSNSFMEKWLG